MSYSESSLDIYVVIDNICTGGGMERVCSIILPLLARKHRVTVLGLLDESPQPVYSFSGINIKALGQQGPTGQLGYLKILNRAFSILKEDQPDAVLYLTMGRLSVFAAPFIACNQRFLRKTNHIACEHVAFTSHSPTIQKLKRAAFKSYNKVVFLTDRDLENFSDTARFVQIPNPTPFSDIALPRQQPVNKTALAVGRLTAQKGFDLLVPAWKSFVESHPGWKVVIVGEGEDRPALEKMIADNGLQDSCVLHGQSQDIESFYREADLMLMSSRFEGLPMSLIEAQSFALPIVSFDCETGPREIVNHGKDGYLVPTFDTYAFAQAISAVVDDPDIYARMSESAGLGAQRFDQARIVEQWESLCLKASDARKSAR
ncbi:glycosyltransferase involved in cell wall biosynthesis [Kushneria sinocarnis]|uniref:Glycosyltransferase involved in cell wall biosynthesis n=1 Tax=Kushneria sinocarnis TaxID=595502 RepID=A0A420WXX7_9GAMM|nr:glycosyltransferase family 4 protein [Kushneria sinocarnis]RKR06053.1 glycosyltransferase involved in cell wall biosynthesis [Kushneria sinocarnis]